MIWVCRPHCVILAGIGRNLLETIESIFCALLVSQPEKKGKFRDGQIMSSEEFIKIVPKHTIFPHIVSAETILFWIWPYVLWPLITVHKSAETIQGRKLFKGGNYSRKYGTWTRLLLIFTDLEVKRPHNFSKKFENSDHSLLSGAWPSKAGLGRPVGRLGASCIRVR